MNYQRLVCWGDSQTNGARTYGCYPLYLVQALNTRTRYCWSAISLCTNGHTARDLWFRLSTDLGSVDDAHQACLLIGANDVGKQSPLDLFSEYYRQILDTLAIAGFKVVHCGEIPKLWPDGHAFFPQDSELARGDYNAAIQSIVGNSKIARLVEFPALDESDFVDPVHFSESGNVAVAEAFANSIQGY